jgi:hypothetical protein
MGLFLNISFDATGGSNKLRLFINSFVKKLLFHSIRRVETQSIRDMAMGSIARLPHQATSSPKLWLSR